MNSTSQVQLKVSLSQQLNTLLQAKADRFGVPVTQFVKHIIMKEVSEDAYPTYAASDWTEAETKKAISELAKVTDVDDISEFFKKL